MLRLKEIRTEKGISQMQMARDLGVAQNTVSNWENGNRQLDAATLSRVADYFGVSTDYLLGKAESEGKSSEAGAPGVSDEAIKFALFRGADHITDEMFEEVKRFAQFIQERENRRGPSD